MQTLDLCALDLSAEEKAAGRLSPETLSAAVRAVKEDGLVVLNDVVDLQHLDLLRRRMLDDVEKILARKDVPYNFNKGNIQQGPPPYPPYLFKDVLFNDYVIQVTSALLGTPVIQSGYTGNTSLPGGVRQPVHPDFGPLWMDADVATPPFLLVVNYPVVDMDEQNGSTEVWPGTHTDTHWEMKISQDRLDQRRAIRPPFQPRVRCGSAVIRDGRMWHAGMPNHTDCPRPMIALIQHCAWYRSDSFVASKEAADFFEHPIVKSNVTFVEPDYPFLLHEKGFDA